MVVVGAILVSTVGKVGLFFKILLFGNRQNLTESAEIRVVDAKFDF